MPSEGTIRAPPDSSSTLSVFRKRRIEMGLTRRSFVQALAAAGALAAFPAFSVRSVVPVRWPVLWGDGLHDDTEALQALFDGAPVEHAGQMLHRIRGFAGFIENRRFKISDTIYADRRADIPGFVGLRDCSVHGPGDQKYAFHFSRLKDGWPPIYRTVIHGNGDAPLHLDGEFAWIEQAAPV